MRKEKRKVVIVNLVGKRNHTQSEKITRCQHKDAFTFVNGALPAARELTQLSSKSSKTQQYRGLYGEDKSGDRPRDPRGRRQGQWDMRIETSEFKPWRISLTAFYHWCNTETSGPSWHKRFQQDGSGQTPAAMSFLSELSVVVPDLPSMTDCINCINGTTISFFPSTARNFHCSLFILEMPHTPEGSHCVLPDVNVYS